MTSTQEWLDNVLSQQVNIWCEDPEVNTEKYGGMLGSKSYLTYRILYKQIGRDIVAVRHRYSEFETLRTELKDRYHPLGILVPSLPPKNSVTAMTSMITNKVDQSFVKERTLGLSLFCENIISSPWLRHDSAWKVFMKPNTSSALSGEDSSNVGETQLIATLQKLEIPYKYTMSQRMEDIKQELILVEKHTKFLLDKARSVQAAEKSLQVVQEQFRIYMEGWTDIERLHIQSLSGKIFGENETIINPNETILSTQTNFNKFLTTKCESEKDSSNYTGLSIVTCLEQELAMVESCKELIKLHEEYQSIIENLQNKIAKLETSTQSKAQEQLAENRKLLQERVMCLTMFYKGFLYFTIPLMARLRASNYRRFFACYLSTQISSSYQIYYACQEFFKSLMLSPLLACEETCRMFELLKLPPLVRLPESVDIPKTPTTPTSGALFSKPIAWYSSNDSYGLNGLFERAMNISHPNQPTIPVVKTLLPSGTLSSNTFEQPHSPRSDANPLAARRGSAVLSSKLASPQPDLLDNVPLDSAGPSPLPPLSDEESIFRKPTQTDKSRELLDNLLGGGETSPVVSKSNPFGEPSPSNSKGLWDD